MAIIPRVVTEASASGAQVIDGSLIFNPDNHLKRTISTAGNGRIFTLSAWVKHDSTDNNDRILGNYTDGNNYASFYFRDTPDYQISFVEKVSSAYLVNCHSTRMARDPSSWYHVVWAIDTSQGTAANRVKLYVNGIQETVTGPYSNGASAGAATFPTEDYDTRLTGAYDLYVGDYGNNASWDGNMSQVYFIDGQALDATYFGYTDPLTNTWRPKKFSGTYSGEYPLADYTGGLPILATNSLGTAVTSGTRADSNSANIVLAVPFNGNVTDYSATIKGSGSALVGSTDSITYPTTNDKYYGSSVYQNADGDVAWYITGESAFTIGTGAFTVECWVRNDGNHDGAGGANEDQYVWHFTDINMRLRMWKPSGGSRIITFYTGDITNEPTVATVADNEWHHIAVVREGTGSNQFKIYVNGVLSYTGTDGTNLSGDKFMVGNYSTTADYGFSGNIQDIRVYNAAKYTSAFTVPPDKNLAAGTNSFYLPFDGKTPIGEDQSGKGNDWTTVNITDAVSKTAEANPILNTISGGKVAVPGVRGQAGIAVTVYNSGSGNKYYLDGAEAGTVNFVPGQTVTFDTSNSTVSGHPFRLSGSSNGSHNAFYSVDFDGTGDYLSLGPGADYAFGTGDFTVEGWFYYDAQSQYDYLLDSRNSGQTTGTWTLSHDYTGNTSPSGLLQWATDSSAILTAPVNPPTSQWVHIAVSRSGTTTRLFYDGIMQKSVTDSTNYSTSPTTSYIGARYSNQHNFEGKLSDLRVVKGTAVYTSNFTPPPSTPLTNISGTVLLCCNQSTVTGATVTPGTITANGDPTSSNTNPYDTYPFATVTGASEGSAGAATTITIPNNAPSSLYYYCTNHSGMGGSIGIGAIDSNVADPYAWKNVLALPLNSIEDVSNRVNPAGSTKKTLTVQGNTTTSSVQSNFYGRSCDFDGNADYLSTAPLSDLAFGTGDFTIEFWVYMATDQYTIFFDMRPHPAATQGLYPLIYLNGGTSLRYYTNSADRITGGDMIARKWYHVAVARSNASTKMFLNGVQQGSTYSDSNNYLHGDTTIGCRADGSTGDLDGYMSDVRCYKGIAKYTSNFTPASSNPSITKDSPSGVAYSSELTKPTAGSVAFDGAGDYLTVASNSDLAFGTGDFTIEFFVYPNESSPNNKDVFSNPGGVQLFFVSGKLRYNHALVAGLLDTDDIIPQGKWTHCALVRNSGTTRWYVDGVQNSGSYSDSKDWTQTTSWYVASYNGSIQDLACFVSNLRVVKGTAVYTASFIPSVTPLTNITNTKLLCCQGTNAVNYAVSPGSITANGNSAAVSFNPFDTANEYALGKPTGYCTWNPLWKNSTQSNSGLLPTLRDGNLTADYDDSGSQTEFKTVCGTIPLDATQGGKWYFETTSPGGGYFQVGLCREDQLFQIGKSGWGLSGSSRGLCYQSDGSFGINRSSLSTNKKTASTYGQVISLLVDFDKETFNAWVDGVDAGYTVDMSSFINDTEGSVASFWYPMISLGNFSNALTNDDSTYSNFGQKPFRYHPPEGFNPICLANLSTPAAVRPDQFYDTVIYTGNGVNNRRITGFNFQPDLVVYKERSVDRDWQWYDSVRGVGPAKNLVSNTNYAQASNDDTQYGYTSAFNRDGFTLTNGTAGSGNNDIYTNDNGQTYSSWCWKAGGNSNTFNVDGVGYASAAAAGLTAGSVTPTGASVGTKQGFSIIKWTAPNPQNNSATLPHGLTQKPNFWVIKCLDANRDWIVYTNVWDGSTDFAHFNNTEVFNNSSATAPTATTFGVYGNDINTAGEEQIAYLWHDVPGVQKFGEYAGGGNDNGTLVELGFRPALVWVKCYDTDGQEWVVWDDKRGPYNVISSALYLNAYSSESNVGTARKVDFLSNGFKLRNGNNSGATDFSGRNYIYCAWAKSPFNNLYGGQANAR